MRGAGPDLFGAALEAFAEGVLSTGEKVGAGIIALGVASSAPVRGVLGATGRQMAITVGKTIQDPIHSWQRAGTIIKTYNRIGKTAAISKGAYDHFYRPKKYKSPASSSSSYQQNGGAGGTQETPPILPNRTINRMIKTLRNSADRSRWKREGGACPPGYVLKKVKGRWMCVRSSTHKK